MPRGTARQAVTGGETVCKMTLAGLFTAEGRFEGEGVVGKEAGRKNREGVYYPQESRNSS